MRLLGGPLLASLVLGACTSAPPQPAPTSSTEVHGTLNQVMRGILFPNSNTIFDVQDQDPAAPPPASGDTSFYAGTYGGWEGVENASIALAEAANLIVLPGRTCQNGAPVPLEDERYQAGARGLREVAMASYAAAQAKNQDAMLDIADRLTRACAACHDIYRDKIVDGKPIPMSDRCRP